MGPGAGKHGADMINRVRRAGGQIQIAGVVKSQGQMGNTLF